MRLPRRPPKLRRSFPAVGWVLLAFGLTGFFYALHLWAAVEAPTSPAAPEAGTKTKKKAEKKLEKAQVDADRDEQDRFFEKQDVPYFKFDFIPEEWQYLHDDPRRFAECTLVDGDNPNLWKGVAIKLKGGAGSFRGPDDKPGLTISMAKFQKAERWRGFLRWHLNNGVQDNSFLNEQISCEIARRAGVPASRCAHALVKWHGRDLGLYVFKESFDRDFLAKFYSNTEGDLYDGGRDPADLRMEMDKDLGDPLRRDNLKELIGACEEGNPKKRWDRLEKILDVDEFISLSAVEAIVCHWDGYNFKTNNYRVYFDADTGKASFWLHGTDQTFGTSDQYGSAAANWPIMQAPNSMVGRAVMSNPAWKQAYRDRLRKIYDEILKPIDWPARAVEVGEKAKAAMALQDPRQAAEYEHRIKEAHDRIAYRIAEIGRQLTALPHNK